MAAVDHDEHNAETPVVACSVERPFEVDVAKTVVEYPLPAAKQTHEMAAVGNGLLLVSQQTNSHLVKVKLDPSTGRPLEANRFRVGKSIYAGLHGLNPSRKYENQVWATLQFESAVLRLDPLHSPPKVRRRIDLPPSVWGPHVVVESDDDLWITCKDSHHVVRVNILDISDISSFKCSSRPIFVAVHPRSRDVYATLLDGNKIFRLVPKGRSYTPSEIDIPPARGNSPVGMLAGPDSNVWFVLLGDKSGGTGTFGRISAEGDITWYQLSCAAGAHAGLIHLAFDVPKTTDQNGSSLKRLWLLGSSMVSNNCIDAIFTVDLDNADPPRIVCQNTITLGTRYGMSHRIKADGHGGLFVTELGACILAHVTGAGALGKVPCETCDAYSIWGMGCYHDNIKYKEQGGEEGGEEEEGDLHKQKRKRSST